MTTPFFTRRRLLHTGLAAAALGHPFLHLRAQPAATRDPFTLGVASGASRVHSTMPSGRGAPEAMPSVTGSRVAEG